jgi:AcrR family transcriptional regulator
MSADGRSESAREGERNLHEYQRTRVMRAAVNLAVQRGVEGVPVSDIVRSAGVSRASFYMLFEGREDCLRAAVEEGVALAELRAAAGGADGEPRTWVGRLRGGLRALLELGDEEPELARVCIARALVDRGSVKRLHEALGSLERVLDDGRSAPGAVKEPPEIAARGILGGALGEAYARLVSDGGRLVELERGLIGMIVLPYLGAKAARKEESRTDNGSFSAGPRPKRRSTGRNGGGRGLRMTYRTMRVLEAVRADPGLSNQEVAKRAGIVDQGQVSKLLARLARLDLVENSGAGQPKGGANAWSLTEEGETVTRAGNVSATAIA